MDGENGVFLMEVLGTVFIVIKVKCETIGDAQVSNFPTSLSWGALMVAAPTLTGSPNSPSRSSPISRTTISVSIMILSLGPAR
jgi:hypothetical protein